MRRYFTVSPDKKFIGFKIISPDGLQQPAKIIYNIPEGPGEVRILITIYNLLGEKVAVLVNDTKSSGTYSVYFNASGLSGGIYYYSLQAGNYQFTKKMLYLP